MRSIVTAVLAFLCAGAGWYYVLHAGSAEKLGEFERPADNRLRIRLRRWGGAALVVIGVAFYIGLYIADRRGNPVAIVLCLGSVVLLLPVVIFLAYVDLRLTRKMREAQRSGRK